MDENENLGNENEQSESKSSSNPILIVGVVVLFLVIAGGFVFSRSIANNPSTAIQPTQESNDESGKVAAAQSEENKTEAESDIKIVQVEAGSFYYKPNEIKVKVGEKVKITMIARDMMHDFNIDELNIKIPVTKAGSTASVEFTAEKAGKFEFYCSVGNHRKSGQVGTLIVE